MESKKKKEAPDFKAWKERYASAKKAYETEQKSMDDRELLYRGTKKIFADDGTEAEKGATHVRNIVFENVEATIDSSIPAPKVTAKRQKDEWLAREIEDMLKNVVSVIPFERLNDMQERTTSIQGGGYFFCEWDDTVKKHGERGEITVAVGHPKQVIPQDGIYTDVEDMDYIFVESAKTRAYLEKRFGGAMLPESEESPEIRGVEASPSDDLVTVVTGYFKNENGGIGRIIFTGDLLLEYLEDYQTRYVSRCTACGEAGEGTCQFCGGKGFVKDMEEGEVMYEDIQRSDGSVISCTVARKSDLESPFGVEYVNAQGVAEYEFVESEEIWNDETRVIPYYKPDVFPVILRKNVSVFGKLLGESDVDKIADQQNTIKMLSTKIKEKLLKGGSVLTLPDDVDVDTTDEEFKIVRIETPDKMSMMRVFNVQADISGDLTYMRHVYNEAREILGITDSFQGRADSTATSAVAKEFSASQSAGRLESKRIMKNTAYARLYETIFKFMLAYADEPRTSVGVDAGGNSAYTVFNRYDFLEEDEYGDLSWNDDFIFSVDDSSNLGKDRERMWAETRNNLATGTFGNPAEYKTLMLFWGVMERLHYPGAGEIKAQLTASQ